MFDNKVQIPRRRRSACADAALRAELERIGRMAIEERVKAALSALRSRPAQTKERRNMFADVHGLPMR